MNKKLIFKKISLFSLILIALVSLLTFNTKAESLSSEYASYSEGQTLVENTLEHDIYHKKLIAYSSTNRCTNPSGYSLTNSPQQVNILSVPSSADTRVVNYTYPSANGWQRKKLDEFVEAYEKNNPGWVVIGAVNGDFFDINGNNKLLPYQTTGTALSDGDLLRAVNKKSVGYTNNGTNNTFIISEEATFTNSHYLDIYDESGNIIESYEINKINSEPLDNELAVYFSYNMYDESGNVVLNKVTVPAKDSFTVQRPIRCLPTSDTTLFAKGYISDVDQSIALQFGQFAIVCKNEEIKEKLKISTKIRVQQKATGDLADCDQIIGVGSTLMENGEISTNNSDGMREQRHPRTCIGVKEDGTLMFFVVDGRQQDNNMYGMTQDELGVMMKYYGCYAGVNIDGGGSSSFGVRNSKGDFVIMNSPSDGNLRNNSNALLIVVPKLQLNVEGIADTSAYLTYDLDNNFTVSNLEVKLNEQTLEINNKSTLIENLKPATEYTVDYSYDITYKGVTRNKKGIPQSFTTGKTAPVIEKTIFDINGNNVNLKFNVTDSESLITFLSIEYKQGIEFIDDPTWTSFTLPLDSIKNFEIKYVVDYNVGSIPNRNAQIKKQFTWYPNTLNMNLYYEEQQAQIMNIINSVNEKLILSSKEEVISLINNAKELISKVENKERMDLLNFMNPKIQLLNGVLLKDIYDNDYKNQITLIINSAVNSILGSKNKDEVESYYSFAMSEVERIFDLDSKKEIEDYKASKIAEVENYISNKEYNKKNQEKVNNLKNAFISNLENLLTKEEINQSYNATILSIDEVKTKGCNSNSILIISVLMSLVVSMFVVIKKRIK